MVDRPLALLEDADPVSRAPLQCRHLRRARERRSDRPAGAEANSTDEFAADAVAVLDATGTERAILVAPSCAAVWGTIVAADHPERVDGIVYIGPSVRRAPGYPDRDMHPFEERLDSDEGRAKYNSRYWKRDYRGFLEFFFDKCINEPHSTKQIEDCIGWALETSPETLADTTPRDRRATR
jgi:pimeloyl-ACP methyl ester carboxylesterase